MYAQERIAQDILKLLYIFLSKYSFFGTPLHKWVNRLFNPFMQRGAGISPGQYQRPWKPSTEPDQQDSIWYVYLLPTEVIHVRHKMKGKGCRQPFW